MARENGSTIGSCIEFSRAEIRVGLIGVLLALLVTLLPGGVAGQASASVQSFIAEKDTPVVVRVHFDDTAQLNALAGELDIWEVDHDDGSFVGLLTAGQYDQLIEAGVDVEVLQERTAEVIEEPKRVQWLRSAGLDESINGISPYYPCYRTVEETYADLAALAAAYPGLASWSDIGDSWDKQTAGGATGYDLNVLTLTNSSIPGPKPRLAVIAAIHAREYTTAELATRFAEYLVAQYGVDPDITWLLDYTEFHLIPIANPDGRKWAEAGYSWRKNTHDSKTCGFPGEEGLNANEGVDLNRNSSFKWNGCTTNGCSSGDACYITYRGESPASEPETQVIEDYVRSLFPDSRGPDETDAAPSDTEGLFISLHSYGELILFPWGWTNEPSANRDALQTLGRKFGYYTDYEVCQVGAAACLYSVDGATDDWSYGELGVASYTFELGTTFFQGCTDFESQILDRGIAALTYAMKASRRPYETPAGPEVVALSASVAITTPLDALVSAKTQAMPTLASMMESDTAPPLTINAGDLLLLVAAADDARSASNGHGSEPAQAIAAARYTVDAPSWITGTVSHSMSVLDSDIIDTGTTPPPTWALSAGIVDTAGWAPGRHLLLVEAKDADGQWGVPSAIAVDVSDPNAVQQYYFPFVGQ